MRAGPHRNVSFYALLATLTLVAVPPVQAEKGWKITQFELFAGAPYQLENGVLQEYGYDWAESEAWLPDNFDRTEVEVALNEAAEWYSKKGFPEPVLEPEVDTENGKAYRVYVCTEAMWGSLVLREFGEIIGVFDTEHSLWSDCGRELDPNTLSTKRTWAGYNGPCAVAQGGRPVMFIKADGPAFDNGRLTARGYATLAHELFHAIQAGTVMSNSPNPCDIGGWIEDGQADAISMDMLDDDQLWAAIPQPTDDDWITKYWGIRPYRENIAIDPSGYPVSSFWAFLADLNRGYDYLFTGSDGVLGVFDFEIQDSGKWDSEVMWLDEGLSAQSNKRLNNKRLNELLGLFLNDFSMRVPTMSWTTGDLKKDWPKWVDSYLGPCKKITLAPRNPSQLFRQIIKPVAGACIWLTVNVPHAAASVSLQTESADVSVFEDILIGLPRGNAILTPARNAGVSPLDPSKFVGIWANLTVPTGAPTLLTFTNAAEDPQKTKPRDLDFNISISSSKINLRGIAPAGPGTLAPPALKPTYEKNKESLSQKIAATTAMISEQKRLDKGALTPYGPMSTGVTFHSEQSACRNPFKYSACGPKMRISMKLMPGTWGNVFQSAGGTGGPTSQIVSSMIEQALSTPFDHTDVVNELEQKLESIDASGVSITMPYVDYGFTGSFNNALIRTKVGGISMESIGPRDASKQFPLIGTVNIEAYTLFHIQGSFSAPLAYFEPGLTPSQKVYRSGPTLTGTFNQVAPWLSDSRVTLIKLQTENEKDDDIGSVLDQLTNSILSSLEQGNSPGDDGSAGGSASSGGDSSGGTNGGDCDCDCANRGKLEEFCEFVCEEEFAVCPR